MSVLQHFLECKTLLDYLKTLPSHVMDDLYGYPAPCLAIFRELPKLAQHYVLRILYVEQLVPQAVVGSWVSNAHVKEHSEAVDSLSSLRVWSDSAMPVYPNESRQIRFMNNLKSVQVLPCIKTKYGKFKPVHPNCQMPSKIVYFLFAGGLPGWTLNHKFRHNLKVALLGGGQPWTNSANLEADNKPRTVKDLDSYALGRWEALLHYLAEKKQQDDSVSRDTILTLTHAGLMENDGNNHPSITNEGFQFLLLDIASQVWYFMIKYLETVESRGLNLAECLAFLFGLSFATLGKDYSTEGIDEQMLLFMQHLREFGLLYQRTRKAGRFYPTKLVLNLASRNRRVSLDTEKHKTGFIVVETNYRLYAYTDSDLQLSLTGMFTDFIFRFPNLAVGIISREAIRQALRSGITAEQIISFLKMHAHPEMIKSSNNPANPLPPTVVDQIRLWEIERNRLTFTESVLYNQFLSQTDYELVRDYAQDIGVLVHSINQKRTIVVHRNGHDDVKKFWKRHSKT